MAQPASKVSREIPKWAHLRPLLRTLEALLATGDIHLRIFMHFYQVFVNNCAFAESSWKNAEKVAKSASKVSENGLR